MSGKGRTAKSNRGIFFDPKTGTYGFVTDGPSINGKRKQIKRRGFQSVTAAKKALERVRIQVEDRLFVPNIRQTVGEFLMEEWLPQERDQLQPSTWESYERQLRLHVVPNIGGIRLRDLDGGHLNRLYGQLVREGRKDGKPGGLKPRTVRYIHTIIHGALKDAVRWNRVLGNAADKADPPPAKAAKAPEMKTWRAGELAQFLEAMKADRYHTPFLFIATTGTRRGEALGLRESDLDLEAGTASIRQALGYVGDKAVISPTTKTGKAHKIELDRRTIAALKAWKSRKAAERLALGAGYEDSGLVFCRRDGRPFNPKLFSREFDRRVARFGLPRIRLHDLRHTWATLALEAGVPVKVVAERLGHATTAITSDVYSHVTPPMQAGAAEAVADLIFGRPSTMNDPSVGP